MVDGFGFPLHPSTTSAVDHVSQYQCLHRGCSGRWIVSQTRLSSIPCPEAMEHRTVSLNTAPALAVNELLIYREGGFRSDGSFSVVHDS